MVWNSKEILPEQQFVSQNAVDKASSVTDDVSQTIDHIIPPSFVEQKKNATNRDLSQVSL